MSRYDLYARNRARFLEVLTREGAAAVIPTNSLKTRNHDCEYRFRPDSDFWYLTGFAEPDSTLVLLPPLEPGGEARSVLFLREKDREREIWTGIRLGLDAAPDTLGVDEARDIEDLWETLPELLKGYRNVCWRTGRTGAPSSEDQELSATLGRLRGLARGGIDAPVKVIDTAPLLHELRLFKSPGELDLIRKACAITTEAHTAAMAATAPGVGEHEIDALIDYTFRRRGSTGQAYTNIVAGGGNACILHYIENDQELKDGDLLLIDAGAEWQYYASDVTRTFPVNGTFNAEQRAVYEVVLEAQKAAVEGVQPGATFDSVHDTATQKLVEGMVRLGLLPGTVESVLEDKSYRRFFMHRTGHWMGLDVHDCGSYAQDGRSRLFEPGMITTVEPGLYIAPDDETVEERWRGIGVRIEDDILVTESGNENLTAAIPKEIDEVEAACRGAHLETVA